MVGLGSADEEGEASAGRDQGGGDGEDGAEAFDGAESDEVEGDGGESFSAAVLYIDVRQCKSAGDFAEECGFLVVGFDKGERDVRGPEFEGESGESGAGAEVGGGGSVAGRKLLVVGNAVGGLRPILSPLRGWSRGGGRPTARAVG